MRRSGRRLRTEVLDYARIRAPAAVVARLSLRSELAFRLVRLRHIDDRPLLLQTSYLPLSLGRRLQIEQLADRSLYAVLDEDLEVPVARAVESIQAISLTAEDAETLQRSVYQPALLSNRLTYTDGDRPILDDRAIMPGDSVVISAERRPDDVQVNFIFSTDLATETGPSSTSPSSTTPSRSPM
jgi:GntR family transcriptional regulator